MKTISILITLIFLFSITTGALAQEAELPDSSLPDPGLTPDSPFYFLEIAIEEIGTFLTFGDIKKAERHAALAAERLAETQAVVDKGKVELIKKTLKRYEDQLIKASLRLEKAKTKGKNTQEVAQIIDQTMHKCFTILEKASEEVPEEIKPAVMHAMVVSTKQGLEIIAEASKAKDILGQGSLRDFCIEKEGASEECEKIPIQGFESFESLEVFCIKGGETPELCAALESTCKEYEVTIPDECFVFLSSGKVEITPVEQAAPTLQGSESLRALCIEKGDGPQDLCEKIPIQGFESFESLENFCIQAGQKPELCAALESTCNEHEVTIPDECFILLSSNEIEIKPIEQAPEQEKTEQAKQSDSQNFELIRTKCLEDGGTPEICTKLVNDLQSSKSPRAFCIEIGGPPEACEKVPLSFESLGAIESYCIESGAPPDQCALLIGKCHEYGVTIPDACFRFLSTAAIITYSYTAPTSILLEEETEGDGDDPSTSSEPDGEEGVENLSSEQLEALAKCLTANGAKFYGSESCVYCTTQKEMFGNAAGFLPYIECAAEETLCEEAGIVGFPTWVFPSTERAVGVQSFQQLITLSNCEI